MTFLYLLNPRNHFKNNILEIIWMIFLDILDQEDGAVEVNLQIDSSG
jgi:hypothetical protein